jgi:pyridoxal biosynthesis lyase PdxS
MSNQVCHTKIPSPKYGGQRVKEGLAQMLKGGVIMDVTTAEQVSGSFP